MLDEVFKVEIKPVSKTLSLASFIEDFGKDLLSAVSLQNPPVYNEAIRNPQRASVLNSLKRKPFEAQQKVIHAVTTLLLDKGEKTAIINSDMGTGKSIMGIATAALLHAEGLPRTLILSPPHLVYKWRREILETIEGAKVWILNGPDTLLKLVHLREQLGYKEEINNKPEFFILGRVRMRMGFHWKPAFAVRKDENQPYAVCPNCGEPVRDADDKVIACEYFPTDKMKKCSGCKEPLWTLIHAHHKTTSSQAVESNTLIKTLSKLPTIGKKRAESLLNKFGEAFINNMLSDNIHQFIWLHIIKRTYF